MSCSLAARVAQDLFFRRFLTMASIAHAVTVDAGPCKSHTARGFYPDTYATSSYF
jgi:hypothetical protein